jgi:hypothetical protein
VPDRHEEFVELHHRNLMTTPFNNRTNIWADPESQHSSNTDMGATSSPSSDVGRRSPPDSRQIVTGLSFFFRDSRQSVSGEAVASCDVQET